MGQRDIVRCFLHLCFKQLMNKLRLRIITLLIDYIGEAPIDERVELLRVLGQRGDANFGNVLLRYAGSGEDAEKQAALHALYFLADPKTLGLLEALIEKVETDAERKKLQRIVDEIRRESADR